MVRQVQPPTSSPHSVGAAGLSAENVSGKLRSGLRVAVDLLPGPGLVAPAMSAMPSLVRNGIRSAPTAPRGGAQGRVFHGPPPDLARVASSFALLGALMIDPRRCAPWIQWRDAAGKEWLARNRHRIELFRLPPYSPELNPIEGVWKTIKKTTTHNRFFRTTTERDAALTATFKRFNANPSSIAGQVARFL
jgi:hypothetical protein